MFDLTERATQFGCKLQTASLLSGSTSEAGSLACLIVLLYSNRSTAICVLYVIASLALFVSPPWQSFIFRVSFRK